MTTSSINFQKHYQRQKSIFLLVYYTESYTNAYFLHHHHSSHFANHITSSQYRHKDICFSDKFLPIYFYRVNSFTSLIHSPQENLTKVYIPPTIILKICVQYSTSILYQAYTAHTPIQPIKCFT